MPQFFIQRPIFAAVIALFIVLFGLLALPQLPIARYPSVAPPSVTIIATYPGASPQTLNDSVVTLLERELSGVKNLLYFESTADTSGLAQINVTFQPGTNPELAQIDIQNRIKTVEPRLPQIVRQNGLQVEAASSGFLMLVSLTDRSGRYDMMALNHYLARNIATELRRINGVGRVQLFGAEQAMRVWVDPNKLLAYGLTLGDVSDAISQQNVLVSPGRLGDTPTVPGQQVSLPLTVQGQLSTPTQFADIVLRARENGARVRLGDVARVELGAQSYGFSVREKGKSATAAAIQLAPGANAVRTAEAINERMRELKFSMPAGMEYSLPFNTAPFVKLSIEKVITTLIEAMVLVFLVMYLFLQNVRYTLIPAIVAPIALLGTLTVMLLAGFSINVLTMFGMVLAIGIIVDDAIVVVENVERLMVKERLPPKEATLKAMREITGAIIGITLVLSAVFIPMAFASGSVGVIYQQFTLSMATSILFSAFLALTLTPALCATLLKPVSADHERKKGLFGVFNRGFDRLTQRYEATTRALLKRTGGMLLLFFSLVAVVIGGFRALPSDFLPQDDQGYFMTSFQLPADATEARTLAVVKSFEEYVAARPGVATSISILGFGFSGSGANTALAFTMLKDGAARAGTSIARETELAQQAMSQAREGTIMSLIPPAIEDLGTSAGFSLRLLDRANRGHDALMSAQAHLLALAAQSPVVTDVYPDGLAPGSAINLEIDRQKAQALGVSFNTISDALSGAIGSLYVNDFPYAGGMQQVIIQADAPARMQLDDVLNLYVRNTAGGMVSLREVVIPVWRDTAQQLTRYQGFSALRLSGHAATGYASGEAMAEMERLAAQLPPGFGIEWTGQSLQDNQSAAQTPLLLMLSMVVVFLVLAALYESWLIPLSVILVVPLGMLGALTAVILRDMPNDVFFRVGLIIVIGLSAKNAILIVEFARQLHQQGLSLKEAATRAAQLRLRPILMTSLAFILGVIPLAFASGASAETLRAIGTGVLGGMISATVLAVLFVPVLFTSVMRVKQRLTGTRQPPLPAPPHNDN